MIFQQQQTNMLELFLKHKNKPTASVPNALDELNLPYKITFAMRPLIEEILKTKEVHYSLYSGAFEILNIETVYNAYDKYTFISKKEPFYQLSYSIIAKISIDENEQCLTLTLKDSSQYHNMLRLSKNLNEYFDTTYHIDANGPTKDNSVIIRKEVLKKDDLKKYETSQVRGTKYCFFLADLVKRLSENEPIRVYFYERDSVSVYM